jgi:hypothetical protein
MRDLRYPGLFIAISLVLYVYVTAHLQVNHRTETVQDRLGDTLDRAELNPARDNKPASPAELTYRLTKVIPHDESCFTQVRRTNEYHTSKPKFNVGSEFRQDSFIFLTCDALLPKIIQLNCFNNTLLFITILGPLSISSTSHSRL